MYNQFWRVGNPYLLSYLKDHEPDDKRRLIRLMSVYYLMLLAGGLFLILFGQRVLNVLIPENYQLDQWVLTMCVLSFVFLGLRKYTDSIMWFHKKLRTMFLLGGIFPAALNLALNLAFIPTYAEYAAAFSSMITGLVVLVISIYLNSRLEPIPRDTATNVKLAGVFLVGVAANAFLVWTGRDSLWLTVPIYVLLMGLALAFAGGWTMMMQWRKGGRAEGAEDAGDS